ncbi:MAG TPA: polysaccharide deacetylase family protein, partial [Nitrosopumilaceae archaeon]|nr:polysaccharide deacetylase family protein [Nitrosopumilaceae archaeon]
QHKKSFISKNGEIFFSSIPSGVYTTTVLKDGVKDPFWPDTQIVITGIQNNFEIIQINFKGPIVVPFSDPTTSSTPDPLSKPVIYYQKSLKLSCNCVAFQINDIQDFWLNDVQIELLDKFSQSNFPVTIGVITSVIGGDPKLLEIIKIGIKNNQLEIANHSSDNIPITTYDKKEQNEIIQQTSNKISEIFDVDSKVFLPPRGEFNEDTISGLKANGYTVLSASIETDFPPYPLEGETLYRFPANVLNAKFDSIKGLIGNPAEKIFSDVKKGIDDHGFAIINFHPQEFAVKRDGVLINELNLEQFQELEIVIEEIKKENLKVVPIGKIKENISKVIIDTSNDSLNQNSIPEWIKNIAGWWRDGHIDDSTFIQAIQYLVKEDIMPIPEAPQWSGTSEIPGWIKETAGWWAEGKISDNDLINGIGYLVNQ